MTQITTLRYKRSFKNLFKSKAENIGYVTTLSTLYISLSDTLNELRTNTKTLTAKRKKFN